MTALAFDATVKTADQTLAAVDAAILRKADDGLRPHLGASLIGNPCARRLWYAFRWAKKLTHEPRMIRLFDRGNREENVIVGHLRAAGMQVETHDVNGRQYRFTACDGHFGGSMDGAVLGVIEAPQTWHLLEMKTHNAKSFAELQKKGVALSKPEHCDQMQCYMGWTGMTRALYIAACKDDDSLHMERIDFDKDRFEALVIKAARIINAAEPPAKLSEDPAYYLCRFCDYHAQCHGDAVPFPTCRSCAHSSPATAGGWHCARHQKPLQTFEQKKGCQAHRFIPAVINFAESIDADEPDNWIRYRNRKTGAEFVNGAPPDGFSSEEIASVDPAMLGDQVVADIKTTFGDRKSVV